jgi:hypothetical protein
VTIYFRTGPPLPTFRSRLPYAAFANGKSDRHLRVLENAGTTGSREPIMLYELYKMKGLNSRAAEYRARTEKKYADSAISQFLDRIDARYPDNGIIPNQ